VTDLVLIYESLTSASRINSEWRMTEDESLTNEWILSSEFYITTDGQSAGLSWNKAPIWGLRPDFYYCQTVVGLLRWSALSDERRGLSFTIVAGPRQRSHSRVRIQWDSWPILLSQIRNFPFCRLLRIAVLRWRWMNSSLHGRLHRLAVSMENVCCLFISTETFVESSFTRRRLLYWVGL
jgi:hypothetical protein